MHHAGYCSGWNSRKKTPSFARIFARRRSRFTGHVIPVKTYVENNIFNPTISLIYCVAMTARINYIPTANWRFFIHQQADFETKNVINVFTIWIIIYEFFAVLYGEIREYCNSFDIRFGAKVGDVDMRLIYALALLFTQLFFNLAHAAPQARVAAEQRKSHARSAAR